MEFLLQKCNNGKAFIDMLNSVDPSHNDIKRNRGSD